MHAHIFNVLPGHSKLSGKNLRLISDAMFSYRIPSNNVRAQFIVLYFIRGRTSRTLLEIFDTSF